MNSSLEHHRIMELFDQARTLRGPERRRFLDRLGPPTDDSRQYLERLLAHDATPLGIIDAIERGAAVQLIEHELTEAGGPPATRIADGERLGDYTVVRLIATGGMGVVYEARQHNPDRPVALKVIRAEAADNRTARRLEREAHVLGRLQHPAIATVFDAGVSDLLMPDGRAARLPFFAMELIDGQPLDQFLDAANLPVSDVLALFVSIAEAIQYAHEQGIIHRDLKPANILVTRRADRSAPAAKILDFGIARIVDARDPGKTLETNAGQLLGTVAYMSPEQAAGDPVDGRTDVYALGVLLYECLSGQLPHPTRDQPLYAALQMIQHDEPPRLGGLDPRFRGDLETIVHKALEKDPARRYQQVGELADDVQRFLNDEPLAARRASTIYQLHKFARRNRTFVSAAAVVVLALLIGASTATWFAIQARTALDEAQQANIQKQAALDAAEQAVARANAVNAFLTQDLLTAADPENGGTPDLKLLDAIRTALPNIDAAFADQPAVAAELHHTVAELLRQLGDYRTAQHHAARAVELRRATDGPAAPDTLSSRLLAARIDIASGHPERARPVVQHILDQVRPAATKTDALLELDALAAMGDVDYWLQNEAEAYAHYLAAHDATVAMFGAAHPRAIDTLAMIGRALHHLKRYPEAEQVYRDVLAAQVRLHGPDHPKTAHAHHGLGIMLLKLDRLDEAEAELLQSIDTRTELFGRDHPLVAATLYDLGRVYIGQNRLDEALDVALRALEVQRVVYGEEHEHVPRGLNMVAHIFKRKQDPASAAPYYRESLALYRKTSAPDSTAVAIATLNVARNLLEQGHAADALPKLEEAVELCERAFPSGSGIPAAARLALARACLATGRAEAAAQHFRQLAALDPTTDKRLPAVVSAARRALAQLRESQPLSDAP